MGRVTQKCRSEECHNQVYSGYTFCDECFNAFPDKETKANEFKHRLRVLWGKLNRLKRKTNIEG